MSSCTPTRRATHTNRADWRSILAESVCNSSELCRLLGLDPGLASAAESAAADFPLLAPRPFLDRIRRGDPNDPLLLQVLPQAAETAVSPGFSPDPLGEAGACRRSGLLGKYQGRLLMVASERCAVHCRFCFRRHFPYKNLPPLSDGWQKALFEINADRSIHEVILSGGDPLMLSDENLAYLGHLFGEIPHLRRLRIHSRLPVLIPQRVTSDLIEIFRGIRLPLIMVVHVNHPAEIDAEVADAFGRLIDSGVPVLSQSVLLHGINDRVDVLAALFERLVDLRVIPYYLHQLDPVAGAAHFEVPISAGLQLMERLRARLPGYAVPRYVRETRGGASKTILA